MRWISLTRLRKSKSGLWQPCVPSYTMITPAWLVAFPDQVCGRTAMFSEGLSDIPGMQTSNHCFPQMRSGNHVTLTCLWSGSKNEVPIRSESGRHEKRPGSLSRFDIPPCVTPTYTSLCRVFLIPGNSENTGCPALRFNRHRNNLSAEALLKTTKAQCCAYDSVLTGKARFGSALVSGNCASLFQVRSNR
jgi:hypothetical protein